MLSLCLIASHFVGDFVFQTRFQAERKLVDWHARVRHVNGYTLAFYPLALWRSWPQGPWPSGWHASAWDNWHVWRGL